MHDARRLRIHGLVQGVGYRIALSREARRLNVTGWVRNRSDGSVEALVQGVDESIAAIIEWCQHGPRGARVERVDVVALTEPSVDNSAFTDFAVLSSH